MDKSGLIAALLKSHVPGLNPTQIRQELIESAVDLGDAGPDTLYGYGRVDAYRALTEWGTIATNTTWGPSDTRDGVRYISGDLTIAAGVTLEILPGTTIKIATDDDLAAGSDSAKVEIKVQGTLIANGTAVNPIVFDRWGETGDWAGIFFDTASDSGAFNGCQIRHAETAIESYAPLTVRNSIISDCTNGVVSVAGGALIHGSQLNSLGHIGIDLQSDQAVVRNTIVDGAVDYGVRVFANTVTTLKLRGSEFDNSGIGLFVDGNATVGVDSSCFFYQNGTGIHLYDCGSTVSIRNSGITWNSDGGIVCDGSSAPQIVDNIFSNNGGAIYCSNACTPKIQGNQIQSSHTNAITVVADAAPDIGHSPASGSQSIGDNSISTATKFVVNSTGSTIYAQNNCWNVNTGGCSPPSSKFTGSVSRTDPICCSFPAFTHGEGEPVPTEGFVFQADSPAPTPKPQSVTGLISIVPNPFNPITTIGYSLASQSSVQMGIYDVAGRLVRTLVSETETAGQHSIEWKGVDDAGSRVASGIYFVRMVAGSHVFTRKMVLLK